MPLCGGTTVKVNRDQSIPKIVVPPETLSSFLRVLTRDGIRTTRLNSSSKPIKKTIVADSSLSTLKYVPTTDSKKAFLKIKDIWEIRVGYDSTSILRGAKLDEDSFCFAIVTKDGVGWNFVCDSQRELTNWTQAVSFMVRSSRAILDEDPRRARLLELWIEADQNNDKKLSFKELTTIVEKMNISIDPGTLRKLFIEVDTDASGSLDYQEFCQFFATISTRSELKALYAEYAESMPAVGMTTAEAQRFFEDAQGESLSMQAVQNIFDIYNPRNDDGDSASCLSFSDFCSFLLNPRRNSSFHPKHQAIHEDMDKPLHEYYCASSHNTYLSGDQLASKSKPEMYRRALLTGCRCVELDCWDGDDGIPIIYHGWTRTSKIKFLDVLHAIKESAFETSPYPVILSLEVHTSQIQSEIMAANIESIFGSSLYTLANAKADGFSKWSPEALRGKILVKWKATDTGDDDDKDDQADEIQTEKKKKDKHHSSCEALSKTVMVAAQKFGDWGESAATYNISSFAEAKTMSYFNKERRNFTKQNTRMMSRIYPAGTRVNSSNYDPLPPLEMGAQLVALNYQTWDGPMRLYSGFFEQNGRCGYLLKPDYLRDVGIERPTAKYTLRVIVLLGSQLPKPEGESAKGEIIDPYVEVQLRGVEADTKANKVHKTKVVNDNGFSPMWNETFEFTITNLDLAMLTLRVMDKDIDADDEIGECNVPVSAIRQGYRSMELRQCVSGRLLDFSTVLCHFSFEREE